MASIPLVSGGSQPVFSIDTLNGPQLASNVAYTPSATPKVLSKVDTSEIVAGKNAGPSANGATIAPPIFATPWASAERSFSRVKTPGLTIFCVGANVPPSCIGIILISFQSYI